jgi:hypothetical protein
MGNRLHATDLRHNQIRLIREERCQVDARMKRDVWGLSPVSLLIKLAKSKSFSTLRESFLPSTIPPQP